MLTNYNMYNANSPKTPLARNSRFDSLKSLPTEQKYPRTENNWHTQTRLRPKTQPSRNSESKLFATNQVSLGDFMDSNSKLNEKYVSPAMRNRSTTFKVMAVEKKKKPAGDLSINMFPMINESSTSSHCKSTNDFTTTKYLDAAAMNEDEYDEQQRSIEKQNDTTVYSDNDKLATQSSHNDDPEEYQNDEKEPVCPYAAAKAAMGMLRFHQRNRDAQNAVFGAQSEYWGTKSLLDFTFTKDDDSNYASSSEDDVQDEEEDDASYYE